MEVPSGEAGCPCTVTCCGPEEGPRKSGPGPARDERAWSLASVFATVTVPLLLAVFVLLFALAESAKAAAGRATWS